MDCRAFHTNLEDYLEGSLDFAGRFGIEKHAERCFLCGKEMADAGKLRAAARDFERVAAPRDFETAVLTKIQAEASARHSWQIWGWWNWVSVCCVRWPSPGQD
jgi:predicted anti-sigma-YlaC factor YlaD